jgi:hypothetical protein
MSFEYDPTLAWIANPAKISIAPVEPHEQEVLCPCCSDGHLYELEQTCGCQIIIRDSLALLFYPVICNLVIDYLHHIRCRHVFNQARFDVFLHEENYSDAYGLSAFPFDQLSLKEKVILLGESKGSYMNDLLHYMLFRCRKKIPSCVLFHSEDGVLKPEIFSLLPDAFVHCVDAELLLRIHSRHNMIQELFQRTGVMPPWCTSTQVQCIQSLAVFANINQGLNWERFTTLSNINVGLWFYGNMEQLLNVSTSLEQLWDLLFVLEQRNVEHWKQLYFRIQRHGFFQNFDAFYNLARTYLDNHCALVLSVKLGEKKRLFYCHIPSVHNVPFFKLDAGTMFQMAARHGIKRRT